MSMHICTGAVPHGNDAYAKCFVVSTNQPESFADFIKRVRYEKRLSLMDVHRNSGGRIDSSYVSRIENGYVLPGNMTTSRFEALAAGLGIPTSELAAAYEGKLDEYEARQDEQKLLNYFRALPLDKRKDVLSIVEVLYQSNKPAVRGQGQGSSKKAANSHKRQTKRA
jgi:transcriptional regulator with XRE-family HTH domain